MCRPVWTRRFCSVSSTPDRHGHRSRVRRSPILRAARGGGRRPTVCGRAARTRAHHTAPHPAPNDTRVDIAPAKTTARAAIGTADARSARATSVERSRNQRSCSAAIDLCGRFHLALASSSRNQRTTRRATRHARITLRASLYTHTHTHTHTHARHSPSATQPSPSGAGRRRLATRYAASQARRQWLRRYLRPGPRTSPQVPPNHQTRHLAAQVCRKDHC